MNPLTDLIRHIRRPDGTIVQLISPGSALSGTNHWRINEQAYRNYEPHWREALKNWPKATRFELPSGMSINTFEHRMRDARQAVVKHGYDADIQARLKAIGGEMVVSVDPIGDAVWIKPRGPVGRAKTMAAGVEHEPFRRALPSPDESILVAYMILAVNGNRTDPVEFCGQIDQVLQDKITSRYDTAFTYDPARDVTTMI